MVGALLVDRWRSPSCGPGVRSRDTAIAMGATYLVVSLFLHSATVFQSSSLIWLVLAATLAPDVRRGTKRRRPE